MKIYQSRLGFVLSVIYTATAIYVVQDELRHTGGGWINLRGIGTALVTFPSQLTCGVVLEWLGVGRINFDEPGVSGYSQLALHVLVSALLVYLIGYGIQRALRRLLRPRALA